MRCRWLTVPLLDSRLFPCLALSLVLLSGCSNTQRKDTGETETPPAKTSPSEATDSAAEQITPARNQPKHNEPDQSATTIELPANADGSQSEPSHTESDLQNAIDPRARKAALAFASDISNNNPHVIERVNAAFEKPLRDPEIVGFYLDTDVTDFEVSFRTAVTALNESNFVIVLENKYANELLSSMLSNESIFPDGVEVNQQIDQYIEQLAFGMELGPDDVELDEPIFAEAVQAIETNANNNGVYFLELNLGSSDTRFIIPTSHTNYERWLNVAFDPELAVERLTWANIWDDIAYNIYDTDTYNLPGILNYEKPLYRDARDLVSP